VRQQIVPTIEIVIATNAPYLQGLQTTFAVNLQSALNAENGSQVLEKTF
jgi:hypothetical protein